MRYDIIISAFLACYESNRLEGKLWKVDNDPQAHRAVCTTIYVCMCVCVLHLKLNSTHC